MDFQPNKRCWNTEASEGQICVFCNCCSKDRLERYWARLYVLFERVCKYKEKIKDYQYDMRTRRNTTFYYSVRIEELEDKIEQCEKLIRCYEVEIGKLRRSEHRVD